MCYTNHELCQTSAYLILDPFPDDSGHFISVKVDDWLVNLDLFEGLSESSSAESELRNHLIKDMDGV